MMKYLLLCFLLLSVPASLCAQRLKIGIRAGANTTDRRIPPSQFGNMELSSGCSRIGFDIGALVRLDIARHFLLQAGVDYLFADFAFRLDGTTRHDILIRTRQFEFPVLLGVRIGRVVRIAGGVKFRAATRTRSSHPESLNVRFIDPDIAVVGNLGFDFGKFFIDLRIAGFPGSRSWCEMTVDGTSSLSVPVSHNITYGLSLGMFF